MDGAAELAASLLWYEAVSAASATQKMAWGGVHVRPMDTVSARAPYSV